MRLNAAQRQAVQHQSGPLLVLAGAGSGKTRVITAKIASLLEHVSPDAILAVSFTNKAAEELHERMIALVGAQKANSLWLSTFHSFGVRFLREENKSLGFDGNFVIFDQSDSLGLVRELLRSEFVADRKLDAMAVLSRISLWKNAMLANRRLPAPKNEYDEAARAIYESYENSLRSMHAVDFDDLVLLPTKILQTEVAVRYKWRSRFQYILIDEFQDTNEAQLELVKQLANDEQNICVVGDDDQSIYGWRGARVENIIDFGKHFRNAVTVKLEDNYRSYSQILDVANAAITNGKRRGLTKTLRAARGEGQRVRLVALNNAEEEAQFVCHEIHELKRGDRRLSDVAVLYRSNTQAQMLEEELRVAGIPYRVYGGTKIFDRKDIKDAISYLRVMMNGRDDLSLRRVINSPPRGIGQTSLDKLTAYSKTSKRTLFTSLQHAAEAGLTDRAARSSVDLSHQIVQARAKMASEGLASAARFLFEAVGFDRFFDSLPTNEATRRRQHIAFLCGAIERFEASTNENKPSAAEFLSRLALGSEKDEQGDRGQSVTLSSLHSAKGLEFPVVFLVGCTEGTLPHSRTTDPKITDATSADLDEERRLFYVGVTRAKDLLYLSRPRERVQRGRVTPLTPSRFLDGLPAASIEHYQPVGQQQLQHEAIANMASDLLASLAKRREESLKKS
ncbi:MAG: 3'-5' exonuclease [Polyangiales bacterium]